MKDSAGQPLIAFKSADLNADAGVCVGGREDTSDSGSVAQVINPDDFLETAADRLYTPERNLQAWNRAYERLALALTNSPGGTHVYVVMGVQGAGKSRWVEQNRGRLGQRAIVFDAALPARRHREKLLAIIKGAGVPVIGVFVQATLEQALLRNAQRTPDKQVPEQALKSVFSMLEAPTEAEGFFRVEQA